MRGLISGRLLNKQATDAGLAYEAIHYISELHALDLAHHVRDPTNLFLIQLAVKTLTMDTYLDPINRKFADAAAEGPPLYTKSDRKSTRLNSSHSGESRMPSSA